jgi:hypothetical protein
MRARLRRKVKRRYPAFTLVESEDAARRRCAALGTIGASAGAAAQSNWRGFSAAQFNAPRSDKRRGKAGFKPQSNRKFCPRPTLRSHCSRQREPARAVFKRNALRNERTGGSKRMVELP